MTGLDYRRLLGDAFRDLVRRMLQEVADNGLPGDKYFTIVFQTMAPGVDLPTYIVERNPDVLTIILQHWFQDLHVDEHGISVTLSFDNRPVRIAIPFAAICTFADPGAKFFIQFDPLIAMMQDRQDKDDSGAVDDTIAAAPGSDNVRSLTVKSGKTGGSGGKDGGTSDMTSADDAPTGGDGSANVVDLGRFRET